MTAADLSTVLATCAAHGVPILAGDVVEDENGLPTIDGMDPYQWIEAMTEDDS